MHVVFHHLRDTGLTWMAARGDDALKTQFRGGHTDMKMTQAYIASARNLPATFGEPFPALPGVFLEKVEEAAPPRANARQRSDAPNCDAVGR